MYNIVVRDGNTADQFDAESRKRNAVNRCDTLATEFVDKMNSNSRWSDALFETLELRQQEEKDLSDSEERLYPEVRYVQQTPVGSSIPKVECVLTPTDDWEEDKFGDVDGPIDAINLRISVVVSESEILSVLYRIR